MTARKQKPPAQPRPLTQAQINARERLGRAHMSAAVIAEAKANAAPGYRRMAADLDKAIRIIAADAARDEADG